MRTASSEQFVREASRFGSITAQVPILDISGIELHDAGDRLGGVEIESARSVPLTQLVFVEPGDNRRAAMKSLGVQEFSLEGLPLPSVLAENVARKTGQLLLRAGTILGRGDLEKARAEGVPSLCVRTDVDAPAVRRARSYLDRCPPPPPKHNRPQASASETSVWPLVIPFTRVIVAVRDDMTRLRLVNQLLSSGQEPIAIASPTELRGRVDRERFDLALVDVETAPAMQALVRTSSLTRSCGVIVCHGPAEGQAAAYQVEGGANGALALPAGTERIVETVWSSLRLQGKQFGAMPCIVREQRQPVRAKGIAELRLRDPAKPEELSVTAGTLVDYSERGLAVEYGILGAIQYGQYLIHGVHPRHPLYPYAKANPKGRELIVTLTKPGRSPVDVAAKVVHVGPSLRSDVAGLSFVKGPSMGVVGLLGTTRS